MTTDTTEPCDLCGRSTHPGMDHPLPADHPAYDAFFDASDDELLDMIHGALDRQGWR